MRAWPPIQPGSALLEAGLPFGEGVSVFACRAGLALETGGKRFFPAPQYSFNVLRLRGYPRWPPPDAT